MKDGKNRAIYIIGKDGKFIKTFGKAGEGPGELKHHMQIYLAGDKFVAADIDRLHYFKKDGDYINSVKNFFFGHRPEFFLNEDEFITFPLGLRDMPEGKGKITLFNIKSGNEKHITEFSVFKGGSSSSDSGSTSILKIGLTPIMTLGYADGRIIYGMSNSYILNIMDINGKTQNVFSVKRKKEKISDEDKKKIFKDEKNIPENMLKQIIKTTPDESTYFYRIEVHNRLIYVFTPDVKNQNHPSFIDIFSPKGIYLYTAKLEFEKDLNPVFSPFHNLVIKKNNFYLLFEN